MLEAFGQVPRYPLEFSAWKNLPRCRTEKLAGASNACTVQTRCSEPYTVLAIAGYAHSPTPLVQQGPRSIAWLSLVQHVLQGLIGTKGKHGIVPSNCPADRVGQDLFDA